MVGRGTWERSTGLCIVLALVVGCAGPKPVTGSTAVVQPEQYDAVFEQAAGTLRDRGFAVSRNDYRFGVITTEPRGASTILEPWQRDQSSTAWATDATVQDLRRTVRVTLQPEGESSVEALDDYTLRVEVLVEQRQHPARQLTHSTRRNPISQLRAVPAEYVARGINGSYWRPVSRDVTLETLLLNDILSGLDLTSTP